MASLGIDRAVRQLVDVAIMQLLGAASSPLRIEQPIEIAGAQPFRGVDRFSVGERARSAAFEAGAMPSGQSRRLVHEEQVRVALPEHVVPPALEGAQARDPLLRFPARRSECPIVAVKSPAAIAVE
ncbi:MAG: hypothetical protein KDJ40_18325 [Hyphomicrobiales bacterium]|nr:hypothetical protein [Hyphomicrobiales bacterium]